MNDIAEIMRKAEFIQNGCKTKTTEDSFYYYKKGLICYKKEDFEGAEYWWNKGSRKNDKKSRDALTSLYFHELKHKFLYSHNPIPMCKSRRTCGGNAPHYRWDNRITTGR